MIWSYSVVGVMCGGTGMVDSTCNCVGNTEVCVCCGPVGAKERYMHLVLMGCCVLRVQMLCEIYGGIQVCIR